MTEFTREAAIAWLERSPCKEDEAIAQMLKDLTALEELLQSLKTGDCWCPMGIGHPMMSTHSAACQRVKAALKGEA